MQLSTKDTSSFSLPLTASQATSTSTTPSSSVEGLRDELASDRGPLLDSSLSQHQLRTALTAETVDTRSCDPQEQYPTTEDGTVGMSSGPSRSVGLGGKQLTESSVRSGQSLGQSLGQSSGQDEVNSGTGCDEKQLDGDKKLPDSGEEKVAVPVPCADQGTGTEQTDGSEEGTISVSAKGARVGGANSPDLSSGPRNVGEVVEGDLHQESGTQIQEPAVPASVSSHSSTPLGRHRQSKPSPLATPTTQPLSRLSSIESPTSPFFIPSNPFLSVVGRMPKFQWASSHIQLLDDLLKSLLKIVAKLTENKCVV